MKYRTNKIFLRPTERGDLSLIVRMERSNREFIGTYSFNSHLKLLNDDYCKYFSIITNQCRLAKVLLLKIEIPAFAGMTVGQRSTPSVIPHLMRNLLN